MKKQKSEIVPVLAAIIFNDKNEILVAKRKSYLSQGNLWEFPGGKLMVTETPEDCLKREIKEELGIEIKIKELCCAVNHSYPQFNILLIAYRAEIIQDNFLLSDHSEIKWVPFNDLKNMPLSQADLLLVKNMANQTTAC
jgi:8-oxo-dGTP diphosphatase